MACLATLTGGRAARFQGTVFAELRYRAALRDTRKGRPLNPTDKPAGVPGHCPDPADQAAQREAERGRERAKSESDEKRSPPDEAEKGPGSASADVGMTADGDN